MKHLFTFCILLVTNLAFTQVKIDSTSSFYQMKYVQKAIKEADSTKSSQPIKDLLNSNKITDPNLKLDLLEEQAYYLADFYKLYKHKIITDVNVLNKCTNEVLDLYKVAIDQSNCKNKIMIQYSRYDLLMGLYYDYKNELDVDIVKLLKNDCNELTKAGYKLERYGPSIGIFVQRNKYNSIGLYFSPFYFFKGVSKLYDTCSNRYYYPLSKSIHSVSLVNLSYCKYINSNLNDFSISIIDLNSPFVLNVTRFGFQFLNLKERKIFYYSPGIGFSIANFTASFSYNFNLSKISNFEFNEYQFICKWTFPIANRFKIKD